MPEMSRLLLVLHLCIRDGGLTHRAPVDDPGTFVNVSLFVQTDKYLQNRLRAALIHGKTLSVPVAGAAQLFQLVDDGSAVFLFPLPRPFQETLSAQLPLVNTFLTKLIRHLDLRGDGCVVRAGNPQGIVSLHPFITDQNILQRLIQRMPHVELSGHVWRRNHDSKRFSAPVRFRMKIFSSHPFGVGTFLNGNRIIGFG